MKCIEKLPIAHRGLHKGFEIPENSILAFNEAIKNNYAIEFDVQITKDKKLVVFHDEDLKRICFINKKVSQLTYDELKNLKLYKTSQGIHLLEDVLNLVKGKVPLLIEIKNYADIPNLQKQLCFYLDKYEGEFCICSFDNQIVKWFEINRANFKRALIYGDIKEYAIRFHNLVFLQRLLTLKVDFISLDYDLLDTFIPFICKCFDTPLISWTINSQEKKEKAKKIVRNIIFENIKP